MEDVPWQLCFLCWQIVWIYQGEIFQMKISMIPYGLLSGFMDRKEIRITELGEDGFQFRLVKKCLESEKFKPQKFVVCFYDMKSATYRKVEIRQFEIESVPCIQGKEERGGSDLQTDKKADEKYFYRQYFVKVNQEDYVSEVQRLAGEYSRYIWLKLDGDEGELAKALTGYPAELDEIHCVSLEEQKKRWGNKNRSDRISKTSESIKNKYQVNISMPEELEGPQDDTEFALELNHTSMYDQYLHQPLQDFLVSYWRQNNLTHSWLASRIPDRLYIGNQFCHNLFPTEQQLFFIMEKMCSEGLTITLAFSYIREFMIPSGEKLLEKVDKWCCTHDMNVEIVVNDWAMAEILHEKTSSHLSPVFGILLNKRKKDPRVKYKSGDTALFQKNSLNAEFYREFLAEEFNIYRYEWESCGYPQEFPPGKNSLHLPFYQTNTSQYCPLYALCTTGDRGMQRLAEQCPKFCEKYALLCPEHLHMAGMYNSLFGVDKTFLEEPEMWKKIKGVRPDRIVVNL